MVYIERVTEMKPTKLCLGRRTVTVVMERQQNNFQLLEYYSIVK